MNEGAYSHVRYVSMQLTVSYCYPGAYSDTIIGSLIRKIIMASGCKKLEIGLL